MRITGDTVQEATLEAIVRGLIFRVASRCPGLLMLFMYWLITLQSLFSWSASYKRLYRPHPLEIRRYPLEIRGRR